MQSAYFRLEKSLHTPNAWAVSVPIEIARMVLSCKAVRRAAAKVLVHRDRVYLVLWTGVDPRWLARTVFRVMAENEVLPEVTARAVPSAQCQSIAPRRREPKALAC